MLLPLQTDEIANTLAATTAPAAPLTFALAAIHAAGTHAIRDLLVDDIDLGNRRLVIAARVRPLNDLTRQALNEWLDYRRAR